MKKAFKIILLMVLLFLFLNVITNCRYMYGNDRISIQGLQYVTHDLLPICFAGAYSWDEDTTNAVIDVLDICQGHYVTSLGGHTREPFLVNIPQSQYACLEESLPDNALIKQYNMTINIGENIREAECIEMDWYHCVGEAVFVKILVSVNCSEENPYFYAEEGKLYKRADNSLVEGFFYSSDTRND